MHVSLQNIGVTGNCMDQDVFEYLEAGADMVIAKPLNMASLGSLLLHVVRHGPISKYPLKLEDSQRVLDWVSIEKQVRRVSIWTYSLIVLTRKCWYKYVHVLMCVCVCLYLFCLVVQILLLMVFHHLVLFSNAVHNIYTLAYFYIHRHVIYNIICM